MDATDVLSLPDSRRIFNLHKVFISVTNAVSGNGGVKVRSLPF